LGSATDVLADLEDGAPDAQWDSSGTPKNPGLVRISDLGVCDHFIFKAFPSKVDTIARK
jgi:hypothetical protein